MHKNPATLAVLRAGAALLALLATGPALMAQSTPRPADWSEASHGDAAVPDYDTLFSTDRVHELRIRIAPEDFLAMQEDLATISPAGALFGGRRGAAPGFPASGRGNPAADFGDIAGQLVARLGASTAACEGLTADAVCSIDGTAGRCLAIGGAGLSCLSEQIAGFLGGARGFAGAGGVRGAGGFDPAAGGLFGGAVPQLTSRDPIYAPVTVTYEGRTWSGVGMRYKGNSSLMSAAMSQAGKIPFRLDFDRYEDEMPATRNQRFFGFQKLTFSSNFTDDSMLKEVLATEAFRDQGVPAARAAFYRVFVDVGNGDEYWGLYTMIEDPADGAMLAAQFGDGDGNLYKPEGPGANWTLFDEAGFSKKTNEKAADFSDVEAAIAALHAPQTDPAAWRAGLETRFDVDVFLRWLAVNSLIANWDSYGRLAHNYYLYGDPSEAGQLHWIPWDHNMAFGMAGGGGMFPPGAAASPFGGAAGPDLPAFVVNIARNSGFGDMGGDPLRPTTGSGWPLVERLLADPEYQARYRDILEQALLGLLAPEPFAARVQELHAMIAPFVVGANGERPTHTTLSSAAGFENSAALLVEQMARQRASTRAALAAAAP